MHQSKNAKPPSLGLAVLVTLVTGGFFWVGLQAWSLDQLFADTYSNVLYWEAIRGSEEPSLTPTLTTPKPLPILVTGLAWEIGQGILGIQWVWLGLGALMAGLIFTIGDRVFGRGGGALGCLFFLCWPSTFEQCVSARASVLASLFLLLAVERLLSSGRFGRGAGFALLMAGLVRPEAWVLSAGLLAIALFQRLRKEASPAVSLGGAVLALSAPVVWFVWDAIFFGDPAFSREATKLWIEVLRGDPPDLDFPTFAEGTARWLVTAMERIGVFPVLVALIGFWGAHARGYRLVVFLPLAVLVWTSVIIAFGVMGLTSSLRFLDPAFAMLWPFIGGALATALSWKTKPSRGMRVLFVSAIAAVALFSSIMTLRDRRTTVEHIEAPTRNMIAAVADVLSQGVAIDSSESRTQWLIDNDVASRFVVETKLRREDVVNLQVLAKTGTVDAIQGGSWRGFVLDDRLNPRASGTESDRAIRELSLEGEVLYHSPGCLLVLLGKDTR